MTLRLVHAPDSLVLHVMGCTCAGKSTLLRIMKERFRDRVHLVEVGKELTKKYLDPESPDYEPDIFEGEAAPERTQEEAWAIYLREVNKGLSAGVPLILVDGQPRDVPQVDGVFEDVFPAAKVGFLLVHADRRARELRLTHRFPNWSKPGTEDANEYLLRLARLDTDYRSNYEVLAALAQRGQCPRVLNTSFMPNGESGLEVMRGVTQTVWNEFIDDT